MTKTLEILKALSDMNRLRIVAALRRYDELCACQITELLQVTGATVSRHLGQMKAVGLVEDEKRGRMIFYRPRVKCLASFFGCIESVIQSHVDDQQDLLTL